MKILVSMMLAVALLACGDKTECTDATTAPDAICVPDLAVADVALTIEAQAGCTTCGETVSGCQVNRVGDKLEVALVGQTCTLPKNVACAAVCGIETVSCALPALPEGDYVIEGLRPGTSTTTLTLKVRSAGTSTTCKVPAFPG